MKPLMIDLFCGLGGWADGGIAEGYNVIGFDIERHDYGNGGYPGQLVLQDVLTLHGSQFKNATVIVASPPCQEFSYMAMPWSLAKEKQKKIEADPVEQKRLTALFGACFRIQREASEAAGHWIPMIVENVRGAQKWVGRSRWHYGSYHLWGDVPALMPIILKRQTMKAGDMGWRRDGKGTGYGVKFSQTGAAWFDGKPRDVIVGNKGPAAFGSKSSSRKAASAMIAKIPFALARHIARCFKTVRAEAPQSLECVAPELNV
jgi:hypothetical protein